MRNIKLIERNIKLIDWLMAGTIVVLFAAMLSGVVAAYRQEAINNANPRIFTVTTPQGQTVTGVKFDGGGYGWQRFKRSDGRSVVIEGPYTAIQEKPKAEVR